MKPDDSAISHRHLRIVHAIASGCTRFEAAAETGLSRSTVQRALRDPAVQQEIERLRGEASRALAQRLPDLIRMSCDRLHEALTCTNPVRQLRATEIILRLFGPDLIAKPDTAITIEHPQQEVDM